MSLPSGEVIYQAYPLSFADGNGDGVGDFEGITSRLPYLQDELGVDGLWLSPFYESPWRDGGYDISDYFAVNEAHGSLAESEHMLAVAQQRNFAIIADFVPSHSSDRHPKFQAALQDPNDTHYIFHDGPHIPNNWLSVFPRRSVDAQGQVELSPDSAWRSVAEYWPHAHPQRLGQYCLTNFAAYQPNWNLRNPAVITHHQQALRTWLARGIRGFRVDAIDYMDHHRLYPDEPLNSHYQADSPPYDQLQRRFSMRGPNAIDHLRRLVSTLDDYPDSYMMLESYPDRDDPAARPAEHYAKYYREFGRYWAGKVAPFCFEITDLPWDAAQFKHAIDDFQAVLRPQDIPIYPGGNHDKRRIASRIGEDAARAAAVMQLCLPGVIVIYQGDELGMTDHTGIPHDKLTDPWLGRDVARTPLPMHARNNKAGYSEADPQEFRLPIHPDFRRFNVATQQADPNAIWHTYRAAIQIRKQSAALKYGGYEAIATDTRQVYAFARTSRRGECYVAATNFTKEPAALNLGALAAQSDVIVSSRPCTSEDLVAETVLLQPHESLLLRPR